MNSQNNWYDSIAEQVSSLKVTFGEKEFRRYKLDLLLCVAERIAGFSLECGQCQIFQQDISNLLRELDINIQVNDRDKRRAHLKRINKMISHLQRQHKLVTEGYYIGIGIAIGSGIGVVLGAGLDNVGSGIPIGVGIGVAIGAVLNAKARNEGRVICPREKAAASQRTKLLIVVGLIALALGGLVAFLLYRFST